MCATFICSKLFEDIGKHIFASFFKSLLQNQQPTDSHTEAQREKMEKLESECLKLSRTQALAEVMSCVLGEKRRHAMITGRAAASTLNCNLLCRRSSQFWSKDF